MAPTAPRNNKITWIDDKTTSGVLDGLLWWRGNAARSSYDESVIIRALKQNQRMGKVGDNNHH
eukprot:scaffold2901_cov91-Skeletonema_dohrnii-CCMP3373.AAC.7